MWVCARVAFDATAGTVSIASVLAPLSATVSHPARQRATLLAKAPEAVNAERVSKTFRVPHVRYSTLKERALHPFAARTADEFEALRDVSFAARRGEFFGIVGRNGSGKSTLLKCVAGIYAIDAGTVTVNGRLSPFIELGVGFNTELSARDNVLINAIMLGLTRKEARRRFDEIIEFAELEEFVDLKLKNYSSGMSVRLGFAVAIQVEADVLLVDEVLAVGDAAFQQKCFDEFDRLKSENRTMLFVTHDMSSVERFCDHGLVLERGRLVDEGEPEQITRTYNEINFGQMSGGEAQAATGSAVRFVRGWCESASGEQLVSSRQGEDIHACFEVEFTRLVEDPVLSIALRNEVRHTILVATADEGAGTGGRYSTGDRAVARFAFQNMLAPSRYTFTARVGVRDRGLYGEAEDLFALIVQAEGMSGGIVDLPYEAEGRRL
jgi:ABC-type polysaccharide/polyol phosphate transport system ATPase subunit